MDFRSLIQRVRSSLRGSGASYAATVDVAKAAPPPSPLAPVDLTSDAQVTAVMEIASRIGAILISAGTSNADVRAQTYLAAASYGLHYCHVDVLSNTLTLHTSNGTGDERRSLHVFRVAGGIDLNFSKLSAVDRLIRSIHSGSTPPAMAERILDEIEKMPPPRSLPTTLVAWGVMGAAFAAMLGGGLAGTIVTFFTTVAIMAVCTKMSHYHFPPFYQNVMGGLIAVIPSAILYDVGSQFGIRITPSQVIASGIIVLVAGLTLVHALIDGIMRAPVTSSARFFEAMLSTGALVAGVAVGIRLAGFAGFPLPPLGAVAPPVYNTIPFQIACGGIGCAAFAYACYASLKEVAVSGLSAATGMGIYYLVITSADLGTVIPCFIAAVVIGLAGGLLARRYYIPPLITMITGYTPLLPGLTLYRSMYATTNDELIIGLSNLLTALTTASALAAGVVLGERLARRMRRPKHFRPYTALRRLGRLSHHGASRIAAGARRIPRVPMSPHARLSHRPGPPLPVQQVRYLQDQAIEKELGADFDLEETLNQLDPVFEDTSDRSD